MSNKNRLDESTIRRFMGLSGIGALGENFIDRLREDDDMPPEEMDAAAEAPVDDAPPEMDAAPAADLDAAEPPVEGDAEAATEMAQDVAAAVADALTGALAQHGVEVTAGEAGAEAALPAEEPAADLGAEDPAADLGAEDPAADLGGEEEEEDPAAALEEAGIDLVDDEAIVQEVARRVAARLLKESGKAKKTKRGIRRKR